MTSRFPHGMISLWEMACSTIDLPLDPNVLENLRLRLIESFMANIQKSINRASLEDLAKGDFSKLVPTAEELSEELPAITDKMLNGSITRTSVNHGGNYKEKEVLFALSGNLFLDS